MMRFAEGTLSRAAVTLAALAAAAAAFAAAGCPTGCQPATLHPASPTNGGAVVSGEQVLRRMIGSYQSAASYSGKSELRVKYALDGHPIEDITTMEVDFLRPARLRLAIERPGFLYHSGSDGQILWARIEHADTNNFDQQHVEVEAPAKLTVSRLLALSQYADPARPGETTSLLEGTPLNFEESELALLVAEKPLEHLLGSDARVELVGERPLGDAVCRQVRVQAPGGTYLFWVDATTHRLRRLEYPVESLRQRLSRAGRITDLVCIADFSWAEGIAPPDDAFVPPRPEGKIVRHFILPPLALPSSLFGRPSGDFHFTGLDGKRFSHEDLRGKVAVLVWFHDHPACQVTLRQLQRARDSFADDRVVMMGVCTEPTTASHGQIADLAADWGLRLPVVRDLDAVGRDKFQISAAPTLVVLDAAGIVQIVELGANPNLGQELPVVLERLLAGENLAGAILRRHTEERTAYQRQLAAAGAAMVTDVPLPQTAIPPRTAPALLKMEPLWESSELKAPGNILVEENAEGPPSFWIVDGFRAIAQVDGSGKVLVRRELPIPQGSAVTYLRAAAGGEGRRVFAASARLARQVFLFDDQERLAASYPDADQPHEGIQGMQFAPVGTEGETGLLVGFWGAAGLHAVSLEGKRLWTNRESTPVVSLTVDRHFADPPGRALTSSDAGAIVPISFIGQSGRRIDVERRAIHYLFAHRQAASRPATPFLGLSLTGLGEILAVGLDGELKEQWSYPLAEGIHRNQIEFVVSGRLAVGKREYCWVFAGPDGSVHVVADDGSFADAFNFGEELTGIAVARLGDGDALILATATGLTAWKLTVPSDR